VLLSGYLLSLLFDREKGTNMFVGNVSELLTEVLLGSIWSEFDQNLVIYTALTFQQQSQTQKN
jgi:hypothetical protein